MSASRPAVSAIIVSYNRADDLRLAIQALIDTEYKPLQIVVVDNASKDNAAEVAGSFPQVTLIKSQENVGFAQGCNIGLHASNGSYVALINNDAVVAKDWFDTLVNFLEQHPKAAAAGGKIYDWNEKNPLGSRTNEYHAYTELSFKTGTVHVERNTPDQLREVPTLGGACVMIRRAAIEEVGEPFLEPLFFTYYEETDFFVRARRKGWQLFYTAEPAAWHRVRASGTPYGYLFHMERNRMLFAYRNFPAHALTLAWLEAGFRALKSVGEQVFLGKAVLKPRADAWKWLLTHRSVLRDHRNRYAP
ncbi:MAG TPA: glycosyltransferase family 2 protein [Polyangiaceae bacterium]|nr:glycosyltransferase family 2 protein [Polyangiaceae bacterium]